MVHRSGTCRCWRGVNRGAWVPRSAWLRLAGRLLTLGVAAIAVSSGTPARADPLTARQQRALAIFKELVEIDTVTARGDTARAAEAMAARLRAAGLPAGDVQVFEPAPRKGNLVARLRGTGALKPVLLMAHLDVVEARREDWSFDPFRLTQEHGYLYGRGTSDDKFMAAAFVANLVRYWDEGYKPERDIIVALETDEEILDRNKLGIQWLLREHRELIDAEFALNEGGGVSLRGGKPLRNSVQTSEKVYADFQLQVTNKGGHSSEPVPDNAIYTLTRGLDRLAAYEFPFELNAVTREYYRRLAEIETGQRAADMRAILREPPDGQALARLSQDPVDHSITRTTCVATRLEAGHANNALPQRAQAVVNCRILPGHTPEEVRRRIVQVLADPAITVSYLASDGSLHDMAPERGGFTPPPLLPEMLGPLDQLVAETWPGLKVIPTMSAGASDATHTSAAGLPTYTFSPFAVDPDDDREHGRDERIGVASFYQANEFFYRYLRAVTAH